MTADEAPVTPVGEERRGRLSFALNVAVVLLVLGLLLSSALIGAVDRLDRAELAWSLLGLIAMLSFVRPRLLDNLLAGAGATILFALLVLLQYEAAGQGPVAPVAVSILGSALVFCSLPLALRFLTREMQRALGQLRLQQQVIDSLARRDESTGAYRPRYLESFLQEEVERGRRSQRSFTVCLVGIDNWSGLLDEFGSDGAALRLKRAISAVAGSQRLLDKVVDLGGGELVLLLPETPLGGAETVAWRIQSKIAAEIPVPVRIGIAEFPRDAITEQGLMEEVRQALDFARTANIPVVDRSLLSAE